MPLSLHERLVVADMSDATYAPQFNAAAAHLTGATTLQLTAARANTTQPPSAATVKPAAAVALCLGTGKQAPTQVSAAQVCHLPSITRLALACKRENRPANMRTEATEQPLRRTRAASPTSQPFVPKRTTRHW
jgi:hypothetical protein